MMNKTIHGPMWQFECEECNYIGECFDNYEEALIESQEHDCVNIWMKTIPPYVYDRILEQLKGFPDD